MTQSSHRLRREVSFLSGVASDVPLQRLALSLLVEVQEEQEVAAGIDEMAVQAKQ